MWLHATSFAPWVELLAVHGRPAFAPGWPGEPSTVAEARKPSAAADVGLVDLVEHFGQVARALPRRPVVVGHGFGGLIAELLLARGDTWAAVSIEPAVVRGPMPMSWPQLAAASLFLDKTARSSRSGSLWLTAAQFRLVFGTALNGSTSQHLHRSWCVPAPARPLAEAATGALSDLTDPPLPTHRRHLVLTGDSDRLAPAPLVRTNLPGTNDARPAVRRLPGRGHTLVIDPGWADVAYAVLTWLNDVDPLTTTAGPNERHHQEAAAVAASEGALTGRRLQGLRVPHCGVQGVSSGSFSGRTA
jgi:pimeloyl-ACP methyl ester carboxylesterase